MPDWFKKNVNLLKKLNKNWNKIIKITRFLNRAMDIPSLQRKELISWYSGHSTYEMKTI